MLRDMHVQYGVCGQFMVPSASFATHAGDAWVDRVLRAMGTLRVGLLMPSSVYSCVHAHLPQVQWAGRKWVSQSYSFKGRDICVLSEPRTDATVQSLIDPANDLLHARLPCPAPGHWAVQLQECHQDHLHLPHAGVGPHQLDHVWFTGLRDVFRPQLPSSLTHRLIHPVRRKKASKRNKQSTAGDVYVVGRCREEGWDPGKLVVLEGAEYWACVQVEIGGLEWVVVTACQLRRQQSRGPACYRVFRECLRELGPVRRAHRCAAEDIPPAPAVFMEVTQLLAIQGQDVWPIAPSNMWQAEHAAVMCRALQGHAAALPKAPAAQSSSNRPAASLALLHSVSRAWCWVAEALEPHSSSLRLYDRGEGTVLTVRPADLEALHLSALSGHGGEALYLQGTVTGAAATRFRRQSG